VRVRAGDAKRTRRTIDVGVREREVE
jgi:hypothetical protein